MPLEIKKIVEGCWNQDPEKRPDFNTILHKQQEFFATL